MKNLINLINWMFGNKKFLVSYRISELIYSDYYQNDIIWCQDEDSILTAIAIYRNVQSSQVDKIKFIELPPFSKGTDYINKEKKRLM